MRVEDIRGHIVEIAKARNWTRFDVIKQCKKKKIDVNPSTVYAVFDNEERIPTMPTIQTFCDAFGITLSEFFADEASYVMDPIPERVEIINKLDEMDEKMVMRVMGYVDRLLEK